MPYSPNAALYCEMDSPTGKLLLVGRPQEEREGAALTHVYMHQQKHYIDVKPGWQHVPDAFKAAREQLNAYFAGELLEFSLPLAPMGTSFQKLVWRGLLDIPLGVTESYGQLARRIGHDGAARAVGLANSLNPICIIVPCHRVIGANGALTGYAGGLDKKRWLLAHEAGVSDASGARSRRAGEKGTACLFG